MAGIRSEARKITGGEAVGWGEAHTRSPWKEVLGWGWERWEEEEGLLKAAAPSACSPVGRAEPSPKGKLPEGHTNLCIRLETCLHTKGLVKGQFHMPNDNPVSNIETSPMHCFLKIIGTGCHEVSIEVTRFEHH